MTTFDLVDTHNNPFLFNLPPTLENLDVLFFNTQYGLWVWNTVLVGILVVIFTLLLAIPAGYSLARLSGRWGRKLAVAIFLTYLIPPTILFIPFSRIVGGLGLQDTLRSEEHTSELQSLMRISYAVFCLKKKKTHKRTPT